MTVRPKSLVAGLTACCLLTACMSDVKDSKPVPLSSSQVAQIQSAVTYDFFDAESARFRNVRAIDVTLADGSVVRRVCGEVNGKNRMGGYVGYQMFGGTMQGGKFVQQDFFMPCEA